MHGCADFKKCKVVQETLVIWGQDDEILDPKNAVRFAEEIPNSRCPPLAWPPEIPLSLLVPTGSGYALIPLTMQTVIQIQSRHLCNASNYVIIQAGAAGALWSLASNRAGGSDRRAHPGLCWPACWGYNRRPGGVSIDSTPFPDITGRCRCESLSRTLIGRGQRRNLY